MQRVYNDALTRQKEGSKIRPESSFRKANRSLNENEKIPKRIVSKNSL